MASHGHQSDPPSQPDADADDDTEDLVEVTENFQDYFVERDGRLFHSHGNLPYPLPVDTPEQERLKVNDRALRELLGRNFVGPVDEILGPSTSPGRARQRRVLDLCCGSGTWVGRMAVEFPQAHFTGVDVVPIQTRYPDDNVRFELETIGEDDLRWNDNYFDIVHLRDVSMAIPFNRMGFVMGEIVRVLRPGGLFISGEWGHYAAFHSSRNISPAEVPNMVPGIYQFFDGVKGALARRGLRLLSSHIPGLAQTAGLEQISVQRWQMPIGTWNPQAANVGSAVRKAWGKTFASSLTSFMLGSGWTQDQWNAACARYAHDLHTAQGLVFNYHTVYARKTVQA